MIEELRSLIAGEVINQCHGCQIDHPSQKQHDLYLYLIFIQNETGTYRYVHRKSHDGIKPLQHHGKMVS